MANHSGHAHPGPADHSPVDRVTEQHVEHHIVPKRIYFAVFFALIVMTWVTTYVSTIDLGRWNIFVALAIAIFKASLVVLFFMHVFYSTRLTKMIVMASLFWLILLLFITMTDIWTRSWMGVPGR